MSTITYTYDAAGRGLMTGVAESGFTSHTLGYDAAGRLGTTSNPGSATETRNYASTGLMANRTVNTTSGLIIADTLTYDLRGLITAARTGYRRGQQSSVTAVNAYGGLGPLFLSADDVLSDGQAEHFKLDAIGNRLRISRPGFKPETSSDFMGVRFQSYDQYGRMTQVDDSATGLSDDYVLKEIYQYDAAGTENLDYAYEWTSSGGGTYDASGRSGMETRSYWSGVPMGRAA